MERGLWRMAKKAPSKEKKQEQTYLCYLCGREILTDKFVYIKTRRRTELRIHNECMPHGKG